MTANCRRLVAVLIVLLLTVSLAPMAPAGADQCSPPGEQAANALPARAAAPMTTSGMSVLFLNATATAMTPASRISCAWP